MPITERSIEIHLAFPLTLIYKWEHLEASVFARHLLKKRKKKRKEKKNNKVPQVCWAICLVCFLHLSRSLYAWAVNRGEWGRWAIGRHTEGNVTHYRGKPRKTSICWQIKAGLQWHLNDCWDLWGSGRTPGSVINKGRGKRQAFVTHAWMRLPGDCFCPILLS